MRYFLIAALALLPCVGNAQAPRRMTAQDVITALGFTPVSVNTALAGVLSSNVTATGGTTGRLFADHFGDSKSILDFGAVCNDSANDSAAITAAIASGQRISIPAGMVCRGTTISQDGFTGAGVFVGPGQIRTSDGFLRGPITFQRGAVPTSQSGLSDVVHTFNGDFRKTFAIEHRLTGASTLGTPSTGYLQNNETAALYISSYNSSGYNQQTNGNDGRTGYGVVTINNTNNGQGDGTSFFTNVFVLGSKPGATSFLANPAGAVIAGQVVAGNAGVFLQGLSDINLIDNGFDVAGAGAVVNLQRTNATGALGATWFGYSAQSIGGQKVDAAFTANGPYKMIVDAVNSTSDAALAMKTSDRIYFQATQPAALHFPGTVALNTTYLTYDNTNGYSFYGRNAGFGFYNQDTGVWPLKIGNGGVNFAGFATITGVFNVTGSAEIGVVGSVNTPFIDFHSSANNNDYDARIIASGGSAGAGQGVLSVNGTLVPDRLQLPGTDEMTTAWATGSCAATPQTGTITASSCTINTKKIGRLVHFNITTTVTTNGTGAGYVLVTLPYTAVRSHVAAGRETGVSGKLLSGTVLGTTNTMSIVNYDSSYPAVNGSVMTVTGIYESAS